MTDERSQGCKVVFQHCDHGIPLGDVLTGHSELPLVLRHACHTIMIKTMRRKAMLWGRQERMNGDKQNKIYYLPISREEKGGVGG